MVRIGDREREEAAERLSAHAAAGRLSVEELEERLERAQGAVHAADLAELERDLPRADAPAGDDRRPAGGSVRGTAWPGLAVAILLLGIVATVAVGHPVAPLFIGLFLLWRMRFAWRA
jgi:hypothetical protein